MNDDLTIPATRDLLYGWCGPVVLADGRDAALVVAVEHIRLVARNGWQTDDTHGGPGLPGEAWWTDEPLRLDLSRAECRDRVCRVLAPLVMDDDDAGLIRDCGAFWWGKGPSTVFHRPVDDPRRTIPGERRWRLCGWMSIADRVFVAEASQVRQIGASGCHPDEDPAGTEPDPSFLVVPALAALDPSDEQRLPDGSRRVDAQALRAVWMEVNRG